MDSFSFETNVQ